MRKVKGGRAARHPQPAVGLTRPNAAAVFIWTARRYALASMVGDSIRCPARAGFKWLE